MALRKSSTAYDAEEPVLVRENVSAEEYFRMPETVQPHNLIEGRLYMSPSPFWEHQRIVGALYEALTAFKRANGGEVILSPMDCKLDDRTVLQPDLGYIVPDRLHIIQDHVVGAPDLVVEVLSKGTRRFDREKKLQTYGRNGVREAWLVDPENRMVTVFSGDGAGWTKEQSVSFGEPIPSSTVSVADSGLGAL